MPETVTHPSAEELSAFSLGQLPPAEAAVVETHVSECQPCCETMLGLSSDDTFVGLLQEAEQLPTDETADASARQTTELLREQDVPTALIEHPRYEIEGLIGKGGMGDVYKARHRMMARPVALKVINQGLVRKHEAVDRFHREVRAAARLSHANIVTSHDAEQAGDLHFLVMEYVDGVDLSGLVKDRGALSVAEACDYIRQAALGLQYAHEQGMVHRDIKPHNLMVTDDGTVKILDFGLASLAPEALSDADAVEARGDLTAAGAIMGTPDFISPEQAEDARSADIRSDIYSLGATLYYLLSGRAPFADGSVMHKLKSHAQVEPDSLETLRNDVPDELAAVISRMMSKDPEERFHTPEQVATALSPFAVASIEGPSTAANTEATPGNNGLLFRLYKRAVVAGIMTPKEAELQTRRLVNLLWFLPIVAIILIGFWSHQRFGSEGITGILLGLYGLAYLARLVPQLEAETASPMRRLVAGHRTAVSILFLACIVGGAVEMAARFNLGGPDANKVEAAYKDLRGYLDSGSNSHFSQNSVNVLLANRDGSEWLTKLGNDFDTFAYAEGDFPNGIEAVVIYLMDDRLRPPEREISFTTHRQGFTGGLHGGMPDQIRLKHIRIRKKLEERTVVIGFTASSEKEAQLELFNLQPGASYEAEIDFVDLINEKVDWIEVWKRGKLVPVVAQTSTTEISEGQPSDSVSPEIAALLSESGQSKAEFNKKLYNTLSQAAGIPRGQWEKLAAGQAAINPEELVDGQPLSIVLLMHAPSGGLSEEFEAFRLLSERPPKPRELHKAMSPSQEHGYVSVIQPEYIRSTTLEVDARSKLLRGMVSFEAPKLYAGRVNFAIQVAGGRMKVVEFTIPNYLTIALNEQGVWRRKDPTAAPELDSGKSGKTSSGPNPGKDTKDVKVIATYSGVCSIELAVPADPVGVMKNFPIYSQSDFEKFIGRIPKDLPSKTNPPPKNDDPLLKKPEIDFRKNMALVLLYPDTISVHPKVVSIREDARTMWIEAEHPAPPEGEAYPLGMGTYTVVIVPFSGEMKTMKFGIEGDGEVTNSARNDSAPSDPIATLLNEWRKVSDQSEKSKEFATKLDALHAELFEKLTPNTDRHQSGWLQLAGPTCLTRSRSP